MKKELKTIAWYLGMMFLGYCVLYVYTDALMYVVAGPRCNGPERDCVFGPGILGKQECNTYENRWTACKPLKDK